MNDHHETGNTSDREFEAPEKGSIGDRLKQVREHLGHTQREMDQLLDLGKGGWQKYESGRQIPGSLVIAGISRLGVNANWVLIGEGEMAGHEAATRLEVRDDRKEYKTGEYALVPLYDVRASAGHGAEIEFEQVTDALMFKRKWIHQELHANPADLYLIYVDGESMEPTLRPGDIILVDRRSAQAVPRDGIYVIRMDGTLLVKRLQRLPGSRVTVSSDNPAYKPFELSLDAPGEDIAIIGRVVWSGRRM